MTGERKEGNSQNPKSIHFNFGISAIYLFSLLMISDLIIWLQSPTEIDYLTIEYNVNHLAQRKKIGNGR